MDLMNKHLLLEKLKEIPQSQLDILTNEPLSRHTTFRIGGNADLFLLPHTVEAFCTILCALTDLAISYRVIGNASNILAADDGFRGAIVCTTRMNGIALTDNGLSALCGASLARCAQIAAQNALSGIEKLSGIPGTVGGALAMNAGANGTEISSLVTSVLVYDVKRKTTKTVSPDELAFSYRHSLISDATLIALQCELSLQPRSREEIFEEMRSLSEKRRATQPLEFPSAGSVFKRPPNDYAGRLIEAAGLKGKRIGDAEISEKHAGFIINRGHACASDVLALIEEIKTAVRMQSDVLLVCEIEYLSSGE